MASDTWMKMSVGYNSADGNRTQHKCHTEYLPLAQSEHEGLVCPLGWTLGPYSELCLMSHTWLCPLLLFRVNVHIGNVFSTSMLINILLLSFLFYTQFPSLLFPTVNANKVRSLVHKR